MIKQIIRDQIANCPSTKLVNIHKTNSHVHLKLFKNIILLNVAQEVKFAPCEHRISYVDLPLFQYRM